MEQSMLDDLLIQDEGSLAGQERIQMDPLQEVYIWDRYRALIHTFVQYSSIQSVIICV